MIHFHVLKNTWTCWELKHNLVNFNVNHVQLETEHAIKQTKKRSSKQCTYKKKKENITKKSTQNEIDLNLVLLEGWVVHKHFKEEFGYVFKKLVEPENCFSLDLEKVYCNGAVLRRCTHWHRSVQ